eukprot:GHVU01232728.1.p3 GENE.GHVU01232728.1~~GHVU01232728.1.p3  ORF type:complete len:106 (+),score=7.36 GHVU01232728.1:1433-1750(+)
MDGMMNINWVCDCVNVDIHIYIHAYSPYRRTQVNSRGEPRSWRGCPCNGKTNQSGQVLECASCKGSVHAKCLRIAEYLEHVQINAIRFTCPMCLLKDMDPFYPMV